MEITRFIEKAKPIGLLSLRATQHGKEIASWDLEAPQRRNVYSVSKSVTAVAVGMAKEEGLLSLDEKLVDVFHKEMPQEVCENLAKATVRDLLTMCLGMETPELMGVQKLHYDDDNWIRMAFSKPFPYAPGEHFLYSNVGPYLAAVLVQRRAGCDLVSYLLPRLFEPLGIKRPTWETDFFGNSFGASGLMLSPDELHKFGLFCLAKGEWNGKQLVSKEWLEECFKAQDAPHYGYYFWRGEYNSFRADGAYCQWSVVFPDHDAVITITAESRRGDLMTRAFYDELAAQL